MHSAFPAKPIPCTVPASAATAIQVHQLQLQAQPRLVTRRRANMMEAISQHNFNSSSIANRSTPKSLSLTSQPGSLYWPFDARSYSALAWAPDTFAYNCNPSLAAVKPSAATLTKPTGRRPRQPAAISRCTARTKARTASPASAGYRSAPSSAPSSARSSPACTRTFSPRPKPKMPGRPPKRAASSGEDDHIQALGKKQPRLERGPDDFSSVVKNRLQSYTRTGQACDRCKVRHEPQTTLMITQLTRNL